MGLMIPVQISVYTLQIQKYFCYIAQMIYDYILVGHGLAGAILAHTLSQKGFKIVVIDQPKANSASNVAAGLINPLAGKRFAKSWLADILIPFATDFYRILERETNTQLFHQQPILKLFSSVEEQNNWMGKSAGAQYGDFINPHQKKYTRNKAEL